MKHFATLIGSVLIASAATAEMSACASAWLDNPLPMGIAITDLRYDSYGVDVKFVTDLEPPYVVGVYRGLDGAFSTQRHFPIAEVLTSKTWLRIPTTLMDSTVFVQVMTPDVVTNEFPGIDADGRYVITNGTHVITNRIYGAGHRLLTEDEIASDKEWIEAMGGYVNDDPSFNCDIPKSWLFPNSYSGMELVGDHTWVGFIETNATDLVLEFKGKRSIVTGLHTNYTSWSYRQEITKYWFDGAVPSSWSFDPETDWWHRGAAQFTNLCTKCEHLLYGGVGVDLLYGLELGPGPIYRQYKVTEDGNDVLIYEKLFNRTPNYRRKADGSYDTTKIYTNGVPFSIETAITNADVSVGTGYRLVFVDDDDMSKVEYMAQRAYSAKTNMSAQIYIPRGFRALSTHNGYKYSTDRYGSKYYQRVTNAVPDKIYLEGL